MTRKTKNRVYVVRPLEKKSICRNALIIETLDNNKIRWVETEECYRWGHGFLAIDDLLPFEDDEEVCCSGDNTGFGLELDDRCAAWCNFSEGDWTEQEQQEFEEKFFNDDNSYWGVEWVDFGDHGRKYVVEDYSIRVDAPFAVDIANENTGKIIESNIKLEKSNRKPHA